MANRNGPLGWPTPTHKSKARNKTWRRRQVLSELAAEKRLEEKRDYLT